MQDWDTERNRALLGRQLGGRLRVARQDSGLLLKEAAGRCGISEQFLSDLERGRKLPSLVVLLNLAEC